MLTNRQRAFVEHYLGCWNAAKAARLAGYSAKSAREIGRQNLTKLDIADEIKRRLDELTASTDEVLVRLTEHARGSMGDFITITDDGMAMINLTKARDAGQLHLIKKVKTKTRRLKDDGVEVETELELHDAQAALALIGRAHKLFGDKVLHGSDPDSPLVFTPEDQAKAAEQLRMWRQQMLDELKDVSVVAMSKL